MEYLASLMGDFNKSFDHPVSRVI